MNNQYNPDQPSLFIAGINTRYNKNDIWDRVEYANFGRIRDIVLFPVSNGRNCRNVIVHFDMWGDSRGELRNRIKEGKSLKIYYIKGDDRTWEAYEYDPYRQENKKKQKQQDDRLMNQLQQQLQNLEQTLQQKETQFREECEQILNEENALLIVYNRAYISSELYQAELKWAISILEKKPKIFANDLIEANKVLRPKLIRITHLVPKHNQDIVMKPVESVVLPSSPRTNIKPELIESYQEETQEQQEQEEQQEQKEEETQEQPEQQKQQEETQEPEPVKKRVCQNSTSYFDADNIERDSFVIDYGNMEIPIRGRKLRLSKKLNIIGNSVDL